jgi:hypothetical protein
MHPQAFDFVAQHARPSPGLKVLDIGGQDMNGTVRGLFHVEHGDPVEYLSLDIADGPGVDIVADAAEWRPGWPAHEGFDVVVCCEVFEHTPAWRQILRTAHEALRPGGLFIATMAGPGRPPHSGRRPTLEMDPDEFYENVVPAQLEEGCEVAGFVDVMVDVAGGSTSPDRKTEDVRVTARRPQAIHVVTGIYGGYDTELQGMVPQVRAPGQMERPFPTYTVVCDELPGGDGQAFKPGLIYPEAAVVDPIDPGDARQSARWPKFLPGEAIPEIVGPGDVVVWIDGRVEAVAEDFVAMIVDALGDADFAAWEHPTVTTMAEQAALCERDMPQKYDRDQLVAHYATAMAAPGAGYERVWQLTILAQRVNDRTAAVGADVMGAMGTWPRSIDQAEFPFAVRRHGARVVSLPGGQGGLWQHHGDWFVLHPHRDGT